jgi:L-lactate dehydrogenase (cytochrome)
MPTITNIEDLRQLAIRRAPRAIFDYVDRGSYDETTIRVRTTKPRSAPTAPTWMR